jgi:hypothetical protein
MKNSNDTIRNRTPDVPTISAMPQPTAPSLCRRVTVPIIVKMEAVRPSETVTPTEQTNITDRDNPVWEKIH